MKKLTKKELDKTLKLHKLWLNNQKSGNRADLSEANLSKAKGTVQIDFISTMRMSFIITGIFYVFMPLIVFLRRRKQYPDCLDNEI